MKFIAVHFQFFPQIMFSLDVILLYFVIEISKSFL